jgi:signal peptidase I
MENPEQEKAAVQPEPVSPGAEPSGLGTLRNWVRDLLFALFFSFVIILFFYQPVKVEGGSMEPGLEDQERIFINKLVYRFESIERGDIVVFHYPRDTRNDAPVAEPYVPSDYLDARSYPEIVVPDNSYYVLGDHRCASNDSREFGPILRSYIYGKAVFGYWPMEKLGVLR